ncbi:PREDICTED: transferrin [Ceratosolen solmsi marchali]|uniref:Transferrin n=1 Tax=Ceratosolen solmsi marchali TaxID=326594 RepID=A0AAJ6YG24_9HYME|nr:PREDICTED: transferrin [Ceratosolen solmsi marchali]
MAIKWIFLKVLLIIGAVLATYARSEKKVIFTMCVPEIYWDDCIQMKVDSSKKGIPISCISGRDRYECIDKVGRKEADIVAVDPEDMYLAAKHELASRAQYNIVEQIRTKEEPNAQYRYEAVSVVHKNLKIDDPRSLRGLKSCHVGVGRNVGYKIPLTKLSALGVLTDLNSPEYSARENELRALSFFFSKACLVGTWSPDITINQRLKETYGNLCALCEKPDICDYPDAYSGYEGALRCLTQNGGDVAWTKAIYVRQFFGLDTQGSNEATATTATTIKADPRNYRYLCPDGTKVPIDERTKPCTWAARPWQGYMTNGGVADIDAVQKELTQLGKFGEEKKTSWWRNLMLLNERTLAVATSPIDPEQHLKIAKYMDVIARNFGAPERNARWCVYETKALEKCRALSKAAYSRDARPRFDCILEKEEEACLKALRDDGADLLVMRGEKVESAMKNYNVKPIVAESYGAGANEFSERPAVAVIKRGSYIKSLRHLKGKNSCHSGYKEDFAGWIAPVHAMKNVHLINSEKDIADFFVESCVPGADRDSTLCSLCIGNLASKDENLAEITKCSSTEAEDYKGGRGALKCLLDGKGQVAFIPFTALKQENSTKSSDFNLVCPNGGIARVDDWQRCNFGMEPPRVIVSFAGKSANALEELTHGILAASSLYVKNPDFLRLFGTWAGQSNILFKDETQSLISIDNSWNRWKQWATIPLEYEY